MSTPSETSRTLLGYPMASVALVLPFAVWIAGIALLLVPHSFDFPAYVYAVKTGLCAALLALLKPWRYVSCCKVKGDVTLGVLAGFAVYVLWVLPESTPWPAVTEFYYRWFVMMPGSLPDYTASWCYAWSAHPILAIIKLIGSACVIAPIEEFFFRGWFMRWLSQRDWQKLPLAGVSAAAFRATVIVFAFEHDRFAGGLIAGLVYGILAVRTNSLRAPIIAHVVTNLILGLHVLLCDAYGFW